VRRCARVQRCAAVCDGGALCGARCSSVPAATCQSAQRALLESMRLPAQYALAHTSAAHAGGQVVFDGAAWNGCTMAVIAAARAHVRCVMLEHYTSSVHGILHSAPQANVAVLQLLGDLWAVEALLADLGGVLESGILTVAEVRTAACTCASMCPCSACSQAHTGSRSAACPGASCSCLRLH
jgi:hypothetical protein